MLTLENIGLNDSEDTVVISFSYEGEHMEFKGKMKISKEKWIASKISGEADEDMIDGILQRELNYMIASEYEE